MYVDMRLQTTCHEHVHVRGYVYKSVYKCMYIHDIYVYILNFTKILTLIYSAISTVSYVYRKIYNNLLSLYINQNTLNQLNYFKLLRQEMLSILYSLFLLSRCLAFEKQLVLQNITITVLYALFYCIYFFCIGVSWLSGLW